MMKTKVIASTLALTFVVTGCENPKQTIGTLGGGALGAWAGSGVGKGRGRIVATAVGAVGGALLGGVIGQQLDKADKERAQRTNQQALEHSPQGTASTWRNPDTGNHGTITPTRTYQNQGRYCREFTQTIYVGGREESAHGTACRESDGTWRIVK